MFVFNTGNRQLQHEQFVLISCEMAISVSQYFRQPPEHRQMAQRGGWWSMGVVYDLFVAIGNMCSANIFMICLIRCSIYGQCNQMPIKYDQVNYRNNCRFILSTR